MYKIGDIIEKEGKTFIITATDGVNYAYAPYVRVKVEPKVEPKEEPKKPVRRRKES